MFRVYKTFIVVVTAIAVITLAVFILKFVSRHAANANSQQEPTSASITASSEATVDLSQSQLSAIKIEQVGTSHFPVEKEAVGSVAYDENLSSAKVTASNASLGNTLAPLSESSHSTRWMVANVTENDIPAIHENQIVEAKVEAYPDRIFSGKITALGGSIWDSGGNTAIDPNTRRGTVRCEIDDPKNELYPGMLANLTIQVEEPVESISIPVNGVVRNGDGTMAAWVTTDRHRFFQRIIKIGLQREGQYQVLEGLKSGELAVTDGAVFLSNILNAPPED